MASYNGHRSWNAWNVSLWIGNDEGLYRRAIELINLHGRDKAARIMAEELRNGLTPDGARYNLTCVREALRGLS